RTRMRRWLLIGVSSFLLVIVVSTGVASAAQQSTRSWGTPRALMVDPDLEPGFPVQTYERPGTWHGGQAINALVGNIDADPTLEILTTALALGPLYAWNADGSPEPGWPVETLGS